METKTVRLGGYKVMPVDQDGEPLAESPVWMNVGDCLETSFMTTEGEKQNVAVRLVKVPCWKQRMRWSLVGRLRRLWYKLRRGREG